MEDRHARRLPSVHKAQRLQADKYGGVTAEAEMNQWIVFHTLTLLQGLRIL